jgi:hypothetical protein
MACPDPQAKAVHQRGYAGHSSFVVTRARGDTLSLGSWRHWSRGSNSRPCVRSKAAQQPNGAVAPAAFSVITFDLACGSFESLGAGTGNRGLMSMAENKTKPTDASVDDYIASRASAQQHEDCRELMALFKRLTRQTPRMWGPSIVGYGSYRYTHESGRTGEAPLASFAIRGRELVDLWPRTGAKILAVQAWQVQDDQVLPVLQAAC